MNCLCLDDRTKVIKLEKVVSGLGDFPHFYEIAHIACFFIRFVFAYLNFVIVFVPVMLM